MAHLATVLLSFDVVTPLSVLVPTPGLQSSVDGLVVLPVEPGSTFILLSLLIVPVAPFVAGFVVAAPPAPPDCATATTP